MAITIWGRLDQFQDHGFNVTYNTKGDSNCQFSATSYLLNEIGLHTSLRILRQNVFEYLLHNLTNNVCQHLELFVGRLWQIYRSEMERDGTLGTRLLHRHFLIYTIFRFVCYQHLAYVQTLTSSHRLIAVIMCKIINKFSLAIVLRVKVNIT